MRRVVVLTFVLGLMAGCVFFGGGRPTPLPLPSVIVLEAQTLPASVIVAWDPNPATESVVQYLVSLDTGPSLPPVVPATCTTTRCSQTLAVPSFGSHTITVFAQNLKITASPPTTTLQSSDPATIAFVLNQKASTPKNGTVTVAP